MKEHISKEQLEREYINSYKSSEKIAKEFNISPSTVLRLIKRYSIKLRNAKERQILNIKLNGHPRSGVKLSEETKNKIRLSHIGKKLSMEHRNKIAETHKNITHSKEWNKNVSKSLRGKKKSKTHLHNIIISKNINNIIEKNNKKRVAWNKGIPCKQEIKEYLSNKFKGVRRSQKTEFKKGNKIKLETRLKMSLAQRDLMNKGIKSKMIGGIGQDNPMWNGGSSFEPYDVNFNKLFKREIRKRDNQVCMLCGIHREKLQRALCIHHIDYSKLLSIPQNCISLCVSCHMKTNANRNNWIKLFQDILSNRYGYKYSESKDIIIGAKI